MSEYNDFQVGQRVKVNHKYGTFSGEGLGTVAKVDPLDVPWPIEVGMDDKKVWGGTTAPFEPEELDIV